MSAISAAQSPISLSFESVRDLPERWEIVKDTFKRQIEPLYGDQTEALRKIWEKDNRTCRLLYEDYRPVGLLVYKNIPTNECAEKFGGEKGSLEVKTLCLLRPEKDSGRGLGNCLLERVLRVADGLGARAVHLSVSGEKPESLEFFKKRQFMVLKEVPDMYKKGVTEIFLQRPLFQKPAPFLPIPKISPAPLASRERPVQSVTLKAPYVELIRSGAKTVEGRIHEGMFRGVQPGQRYRFFNQAGQVFCQVESIAIYKSFPEMLEKEGFKSCIPHARSLEEAAQIYARIPGYLDRARQNGVVALKLSVVTPPPAPANQARLPAPIPLGKRERD